MCKVLLQNGCLSEAAVFLKEMENIVYHAASGAIDEELLRDVLEAMMAHTYHDDDILAYRITKAISELPEW